MARYTLTAEELAEVVRRHGMWVVNGEGGERADLRNADLCGANLRSANLRSANLRRADLRRADLCGAVLRSAVIRNADLRNADFCGANLRNADLRNADFCGANLRGADLRGADLCGVWVNWQSHDMISALLRREAEKSITRRALSGLILVSRDWCFSTWLADGALGLLESERAWAMGVLAGYVRYGDDAPEVLRVLAKDQVQTDCTWRDQVVPDTMADGSPIK